jgi:hypothetical protein
MPVTVDAAFATNDGEDEKKAKAREDDGEDYLRDGHTVFSFSNFLRQVGHAPVVSLFFKTWWLTLAPVIPTLAPISR